MTRRMVCLLVMAALLPCLASAPASALALGIKVTGAGTGVYPPNTLYNGVRVSGLQIGFGIRVPGNGTARGQLQVTLIGTSPLGMEQDIDVVGQAATGSATLPSSLRTSASIWGTSRPAEPRRARMRGSSLA